MNKIDCLNAGNIQIRIIYDNKLACDKFKAAWGFACLIKLPDHTILFDTGGDAEIFISNLKAMNIDISTIDSVMISHDHWDHNAGMEALFNLNSKLQLYIIKSFSDKTKAIAESAGVKTLFATEPTAITPGALTTGEMATNRPDLFEHSLILRTDKGSIIITGCAHSGIVEVIERCKALIADDILFVIGGFHLVESSEAEISEIIDRCKQYDIRFMAPCHCTGDNAIEMFRKSLGKRFISIGAGTVINISDLV